MTGGGGVLDPSPPETLPKYRVSKHYWSGSPEKHKDTKPVFNVGPPSASRRTNAGPLLVIFGFSLHSLAIKTSLIKPSGPVHELYFPKSFKLDLKKNVCCSHDKRIMG